MLVIIIIISNFMSIIINFLLLLIKSVRRLIRQSSPMKSFRTLSIDTDLSLMQVFQLTGNTLNIFLNIVV